MLLPKPSLEGWILWYHQLQHKGDQSLAVKGAGSSSGPPFAHMKGVLPPQGATGGPTSLVFPCNHSDGFF